MVDATWEDDQVTPLKPNPHPVISLTSNIKETCTVEDITNLLILMQVFMEETLDLLLIDVAHLLWRDGNFIPVLVVARFC